MNKFNILTWINSCFFTIRVAMVAAIICTIIILPFIFVYTYGGIKGIIILTGFVATIAIINFLKWVVTGHYFIEE